MKHTTVNMGLNKKKKISMLETIMQLLLHSKIKMIICRRMLSKLLFLNRARLTIMYVLYVVNLTRLDYTAPSGGPVT